MGPARSASAVRRNGSVIVGSEKTPSRIQGALVDGEGGGDPRRCVDPMRIGMHVFALYWGGGESGVSISVWSQRADRGLCAETVTRATGL